MPIVVFVLLNFCLVIIILAVFNCIGPQCSDGHLEVMALSQLETLGCGRAVFNPISSKYLRMDKTSKQEVIDVDSGVHEGQSRIFYGEVGTYGHWPWIVTFRTRIYGSGKIESYDNSCSGALVSRNKVLTAGHCLEIFPSDMKNFRVVVGNHHRFKKDAYEKEYRVASICLAKKYANINKMIGLNDWLLVTLEGEVTLNQYVQPICLPWKLKELASSSHENYVELISNGKCFTIGFGKTEQSALSDVLRVLPLEPVGCRSVVKHFTTEDARRSIHCFQKRGDRTRGDTCDGDSGGPLSCYSPRFGAWILMGMTSSGSVDCDGKTGFTAVYVNTTSILNDISNGNCFDRPKDMTDLLIERDIVDAVDKLSYIDKWIA